MDYMPSNQTKEFGTNSYNFHKKLTLKNDANTATREKAVIYEALSFDVAQSRMYAANEGMDSYR